MATLNTDDEYVLFDGMDENGAYESDSNSDSSEIADSDSDDGDSDSDGDQHENKRQPAAKRKPAQKHPRGKILRRSYTRTLASGKKVHVKAAWVSDKDKSSKGRKPLPPVRRPGWLASFGYALRLKAATRRAALAKAIKHEGNALSVFRRLILIHNYQKNSNPPAAKKLKSDYQWIKKQYMKASK